MMGEQIRNNDVIQADSNDDPDQLDLFLAENTGAFFENLGQLENENILFYGHIGDLKIGFMDSGYILINTGFDNEDGAIQVFFDGSAETQPEGVESRGSRTNHISGNDRTQMVTGIPEYAKIFYHDLYPGIDLVFSLYPEGLKYDWIVDPFADPSVIRETYTGIDSIYIEDDGSLVVRVGGENVRLEAPFTYQEHGGKRVTIPSSYLIEESTVIYDIGDYDPSIELVIDPLLEGTYLGTSDLETIVGVSTDKEDNIYVVGYTRSPNFPTTPGSYSPPILGYDIFVTKFDPLLRETVYSTTIGGWRHEIPAAITVDDDGYAYVVLKTASDDFPTTDGSYQEDLNGSINTVVFKLNQDGSDIVFSTYIGGNITAEFRDIVLDENRNIYLAGDNGNVVLVKLSADGSELLSYFEFGGSQLDITNGLILDAEGNIFVTGSTRSPDFPTTLGCFQSVKGGLDKTNNDANDGFIAKLNDDLNSIQYSTFLGGNGSDTLRSIVVDPSGCVIITGSTRSENFPTTPGCIDSIYNGGGDMTITKLNQNGSALIYSTYFNSLYSKVESGMEIVLDSKGNACIGGLTYSLSFPTTPGCFLPDYPGGGAHGFGSVTVVIVDPEGSLLYATYASGGSEEYLGGIAVDSRDNIIVAGYFIDMVTHLPILPGCYDTMGHNKDGFIVKFNATTVPYPFMTIDQNIYLDTESIPLTGVVSSDSEIIGYVWTIDDKVVYNGTNNDFLLPPLPSGNHRVRFGALNLAGSWKETPDQNLFVHSRPAVTILHPQQLIFRDTDTLEFTGNGTDDGAIISFSWQIGGEYVNIKGPDFTHSPLPSGNYTITVRVKDDHGVWSNETSIGIRVVAWPEAVISPFADDIYSPDEIIPFRCTSKDGRGIKIVHWTSSIDGELAIQNSTSINLTGLSVGNHEVGLRIQDEWGFWSTTTMARLNITARPVALIRSISPIPALNTDILAFNGAGIDDQAITYYVWESDIDGILNNDFGAMFTTIGLSPGIHSITLKVQDDDGFWSDVDSSELHITTRPVAFIDSISPNPLVSDMILELSGHGEDDGSISFLEWSSDIDGKLITTPEENVSTLGFSPGSHEITLKVCDDLGFWSEPVTAMLTVHERPVASISHATLPAAMIGDSITFQGVGFDDGLVTNYSWSSDKDGNLSSQSEFSISSLSPGVHTISLRVLDDMDCWSDPANRIVVIMSRPIAVITNISHVSSLKGETISFSGYGADDVAIEELRWRSSLDGSIGSEGSMKTSTLSPGTHQISFQARDEHGLWSDPVFRNITVHIRPTAEIISQLPEIPSTEDFLTLKGTGTDDGEIVRYRWNSNIDGEIFNGTWEEALVKPLTLGTHTLTFEVQDDQGIWSEEEVIVIEVMEPKKASGSDSSNIPVAVVSILAGLCAILVIVIRLPKSRFKR